MRAVAILLFNMAEKRDDILAENFKICIEAVIPMFILLAIGFIVRKTGIVNDAELKKMNRLAFDVLFPFLMFANIYNSHIREIVNLRLIIFTLAAIGIEYVIGTAVTLKIEKSNASRGAMIQAIYRSNFVIMGLPIATNIYGHGNVGVTAVMIAIVVPLYNILAVATLEVYRDSRVRAGRLFANIAKNPLIIGAAAGIVFSLAGITLPEVVEDTVDSLSSTATPIALMILGASFEFGSVKDCRRNLIVVVLSRLVIVPGAVLTVAALMGIANIEFVTLVGIFAAPCAISSFTMAQQMDSDGVRFWDYSATKCDVNGRICLPFSLCWGVLAMLAVRYVQPALARLAAALPDALLLTLLFGIMLDSICTARVLLLTHDIDALTLRVLRQTRRRAA